MPASSVSDSPMWGDRVLTIILTNPIYTGDLVQGRRRVKSYNVHQIEAVPEEEWVRVADTHEAIISHETFDKVQTLLKRDKSLRRLKEAAIKIVLFLRISCYTANRELAARGRYSGKAKCDSRTGYPAL